MLVVEPRGAAQYADLRRAVAESDAATRATLLREMATAVRLDIVSMIDSAQLGHIGGDLSVTDILVTLFGAVLERRPEHPDRPDRDRFILSKGHCAGALYATLARCGFFPATSSARSWRRSRRSTATPTARRCPASRPTPGRSGHGFPVAVGCALAARLRGASWRTFVVLGDGEMQEGSNWEAAMTAAHYGLDSLTAVVDRNRLQQGARTEETKRLEPLADKWQSFGWEVREVDGHDHAALLEAFAPSSDRRAGRVIANTIKGKGVSFMEDRVEWHHKVPERRAGRTALEELSR